MPLAFERETMATATAKKPTPNFGQGVTIKPEDDLEIRQFVGDGTEYLYVPDLEELKYCRVGTTVLGNQVTHMYMDADPTSLVKVTIPLASLTEDQDGNKFLRRAAISNDGIWQDGASIAVGGVWKKPAGAK